ncbi:ABC-2 transporter permease [Virgibacillus sp. NKC19-3]|uniref:ABC-2 transporter permease n=1 Tax=Virgibacillus saliphilus TaxID=2831674 RepID=UPI001C9A6C35|nr:ABC-2 transporter permease [Virgibacillus sp. NKC19-3]MBY7145054.1 ABC-2 transporter permease [Virgibacillus sp. NKC19-3]
MFNLIRRDIILQKWLLLTFIPFVAFFIIMDVHPALTFLVASIFIPFNTFGYDNKAETNILLNSLPYTRKEIIASRYLGSIVYMALSIGVTSLALIVSNKSFTMTDIAIGGGLFLAFAAFTFPLFYIFKTDYLLHIVIISFILLAGIGPPIVTFLTDNVTVITDLIYRFSTPVIYTGAAAIVMFFYAVSWGVSTIIYQRKAF